MESGAGSPPSRQRFASAAARTFWTYWSASTISSVGSAVTATALPLVAVTVVDASSVEVGMLAAASYLAWIIVGLPSGVIVQRLPLRSTQVAMDVVRAGAIASIPVAWWLDALTIEHLIAAAIVISFATVIFDVGNMTFLPSLVGKDELTSRNSLMSGTHAVTQVGGPSLGGLLVWLIGSVPTLLVDAASYLASALLMRLLPERRVPQPEQPAHMWSMIRDGWRYVTRHPIMGPAMWAATAVNVVNGALHTLVPLYLIRELGTSAVIFGILLAADGVGSLLGAMLTPRLSRWLGTARSLIWAGIMGGLLAMLMPLGDDAIGMASFAVGNGGFAAAVVVLSVNTRTYRQVASPPELLSRVMATVRFVSWGAIPIGSLVAGAAAAGFGIREALVGACAMSFGSVLVLWFSEVRKLRDLTER